jgi:hypothetical protein
MGDMGGWLCNATEQATQGEACKANAETPQKAGQMTIKCRFILKNGQHIDHEVTNNVAQHIHSILKNDSSTSIRVSDAFDNTLLTVMVAEIAAYIQMAS